MFDLICQQGIGKKVSPKEFKITVISPGSVRGVGEIIVCFSNKKMHILPYILNKFNF